MEEKTILEELRRLAPGAQLSSLSLIASVLSNMQNSSAVSPFPATELSNIPGIDEILRQLAGQQVRTGSSTLAFGEGSQLGDVTIGDVSAGHLYKIYLNSNNYYGPRHIQEDSQQKIGHSVDDYNDHDLTESNWNTGEVRDNTGLFIRSISDGIYRWELRDVKGSRRIEYPKHPVVFADFSLEVGVRQINGDMNYGVAFRSDEKKYYIFWLNKTYFSLVVWDANNYGERVIPWTRHLKINSHQENIIQVIVAGKDLRLAINHVRVAEISSRKILSGKNRPICLGERRFWCI